MDDREGDRERVKDMMICRGFYLGGRVLFFERGIFSLVVICCCLFLFCFVLFFFFVEKSWVII